MSQSWVGVLLCLLSLGLALNFLISFRIIRIVRNVEGENLAPLTPVPGTEIGALEVTMLVSGKTIELHRLSPAVLLFMSSRCAECRKKTDEVSQLARDAIPLEFGVWHVSMDKPRSGLPLFTEGPLVKNVLMISEGALGLLNPRVSTPYYLLMGPSAEVQAGGIIGDDGWKVLLRQVKEEPGF